MKYARVGIICTLFLFSLNSFAAENRGASNFEIGPIVADAAKILSYGNKSVFKWQSEVIYIYIGKQHIGMRISDTVKLLSKSRVKFQAYNSISPIQNIQDVVKFGLNPRSYKPGFNSIIVSGSNDDARKIVAAYNLPQIYHWYLKNSYKFKMKCFFSIFPRKNTNEIAFSLIFVDDSIREPFINTCLNEEIIQSFGVFNDADKSEYFSFNNIERQKSITKYDICLLNSLYDNTVNPGDPAKKVLRIFEEKLKGGYC